jgi:hypothetical protein
MVDRMLVAGTVLLTGWLGVFPVEAFGRGVGGGGGFHRAVAPTVHRMVVHHPVGPVTVPIRPAHDAATHRQERRERQDRIAVRHRRVPLWSGYPSATDAGVTPYDTPVAPAGNAAADDVTSDDAAGPPYGPYGPALFNVPACRIQDYQVPDRSGESRSVRVLRC